MLLPSQGRERGRGGPGLRTYSLGSVRYFTLPWKKFCFFERRWDELSPLVDGSMAASSAMVPLVKVEKKIAQISRVIQHLNAKSDDSDLDSLAGGRVERG